ncbi:MAG: ABC transporter permease [Actinomycetota bacterium]
MSDRTEPVGTVTVPPPESGLGRLLRRGRSAGSSPVAGIALAYVVVAATFSILSPQFLTQTNLSIVVGQTAAVTIASFAMTMVILSGGIDLSVGAVLALASVIVGVLLDNGQPVVLAVVVALAVSAAVGLINGLVTVRWRVQPFLVTLGTLSVARGLAEFIAGGGTVPILHAGFNNAFAGEIGGIPVPAIWTLGFLILGHVTLRHTVFGRRLYSIGGNEEAAVQAGTRVGRVKVLVYVLSGLFAGFASMVATARLSSGLPGSGVGFELDVIAAVVLGGTGFRGEGGSVIGTLFGALIIGTVGNGLTLLGVDPSIQRVVKGGIILAAIVLDAARTRRQSRAAR